METSEANNIWGLIERRAERAHGAGQLAKLVAIDDFNPIFDPSSSVFFGRRGAGKTHTLLNLAEKVRGDHDIAVYIDMRQISSNSGIYADPSVDFSTRATNLLVDVASEIHNEIYNLAVSDRPTTLSSLLGEVGPALDTFGNSISQMRVTGEVTQTQGTSLTHGQTSESRAGISVSRKDVSVNAARARSQEHTSSLTESRSVTGHQEIYVHLGTASQGIAQLVRAIQGAKIWVLLDEWSSGVPYDLQPILADMLRRIFVSQHGVIVKIGAIEHRSRFRMSGGGAEYIGLELGADTAETLNLDSSLAISTNTDASVEFMRNLLTEHFRAAALSRYSPVQIVGIQPVPLSFVEAAFRYAVLASEGNPRDAINIVSKAARRCRDRKIAITDVLIAADEYFWNTKYKMIEGTSSLEKLFAEFMNQSQERGKRTVLVSRSDIRRADIDTLTDYRLLHLVKSGVRPDDSSGIYDIYAVDFGSYAEKIRQRKMTWTNDGFANPVAFKTVGEQESWRAAVLRRTGGRKAKSRDIVGKQAQNKRKNTK